MPRLDFSYGTLTRSLPALLGIGIGIIANNMPLGLLFSIAFVWAWVRTKAGRHPAYGFHFLYWHLPMNPFKRMPASARRTFIG